MINKSILIVDDLEELRSLVREKLSEEFSQCYEADTASDAMAITKNSRPDIIIVNYSIPDDVGMTLLSKVTTSLDYEPLLVVYPGYKENISRAEFPMDAAIYIVEKPTDVDKLLLFIKKVVKE